jgi:Ca2+-binding RTX toxin-like protein
VGVLPEPTHIRCGTAFLGGEMEIVSLSIVSDSAATVITINAAPTDIALSPDSVVENSANGTVVGTLTATDPDVGDSFTFSLLDDAGGRFAISGADLIVAAAIDFEAAHVYPVTVRATDTSGDTFDETFNILITNVAGVTITGTAGNDVIDAAQTVPGQPFPTDEEDTINGSLGADTISGLGGDDRLEGGPGLDTLIGGTGNDTYTMFPDLDVVIENPGEGTDTVVSFMSFTLGPNVENLTLAQVVFVGINGTGNELDNRLFGNSASNVLAGLGGADFIVGAEGNDTADYSASPAGVNVNLEVSMGPGSGGDAEGDVLQFVENVFGSAFNDILFGTSQIAQVGITDNNLLVGGAGRDILWGLSGNDVLMGGDGKDDLIGGDGADTLTGGAGRDTLAGEAGNDTLTGENGKDAFIFGPVLAGSADHLMDFERGDLLQFSAADFGLPAGRLAVANLVFGAAATEAHAEFVYDSVTLTLSWDPDGSGALDPIAIASFNSAIALTARDFVLV